MANKFKDRGVSNLPSAMGQAGMPPNHNTVTSLPQRDHGIITCIWDRTWSDVWQSLLDKTRVGMHGHACSRVKSMTIRAHTDNERALGPVPSARILAALGPHLRQGPQLVGAPAPNPADSQFANARRIPSPPVRPTADKTDFT
ncbi:hypothetical protein B0H11DRAFT_1905060 [Mycena galericulata]|nr:hypothetical protein B0H11DRAFT_1905060 [Mycena galericulata]